MLTGTWVLKRLNILHEANFTKRLSNSLYDEMGECTYRLGGGHMNYTCIYFSEP